MKKIFLTLVMMLFVVTAFSQQIYNVRVSSMSDGIFEQMYGAVKVYGGVLNGMKDGTWVESHPGTDVPHYIICYKEDKKNGIYLEFDKQANLVNKADYKNDMIDGLSCSFDKNGRSLSKQEYKEGQLDGKSILYTDRGYIQEESEYKAGKRDGVTTWYLYNEKMQGPKYVMYTYKDGKFEGVQETYYENGNVKTRKMFSNNVANGLATEYYEDGSLKSECTYKNGEVKGRVKEYKMGEKIVE
ncbi:MAG: toxin-antitoxin system YwqK family antitoxin [Bacteroidales bacterium]|nr:toxin-antitoxin system YwqK family antitoxin [Bacteroidales bacterium]